MSILATQADMLKDMKFDNAYQAQQAEPTEVVETTEVIEPAPVPEPTTDETPTSNDSQTDNKKKKQTKTQEDPNLPKKQTTLPAMGETTSATNQTSTTSNNSTSQHSQSSSQRVDFNPEEMGDLYQRSMQAVGYTDPQIIATLQGLGYDPAARKAEFEEEQRRLNNVSKLRALGNAFQLFNEMGSLAHGDASVQQRDIKDVEADLREKRRLEYKQNLDKYNNLLLQSALTRSNAMLNKAGDAATTRTGSSSGNNFQWNNGTSNTAGTSHNVTYGTGYTASGRQTSSRSRRSNGGGRQYTNLPKVAIVNKNGGAALGDVGVDGDNDDAFRNAFEMCFRLEGRNKEIAQTIKETITPDEWAEKSGYSRSNADIKSAIRSVVSELYAGLCQQVDAELALAGQNANVALNHIKGNQKYNRILSALDAIKRNGIIIEPYLPEKYAPFLQ